MGRIVVEYITPSDPRVVELAEKYSPPRLFQIIRDEIKYEEDPLDRWKTPAETLMEMSGDCEDKSALLASILIAKGFDAWVRIAIIPREYTRNSDLHAFVMVRQGSSWIYLDPSCPECVWGEVPYEGEEEPIIDFNDSFIVVHDAEKARRIIIH